MKQSILIFMMMLWAGTSWGQTTLSKGDLAITGLDTPGETFTFVILVDIESGTEIFFSDNNLSSDGASTFNETEGVVKFTASTSYAAGSVLKFSGLTGEFSDSGDGNVALGNSGDNLFAFQGYDSGTNTVTTFLHLAYDSGISTFLPTGFTASDVIAFGNDDGEYTGTKTGTKEDLIAAINNSSNWTSYSAFAGSLLTDSFTITGGTPTVTISDSGNPSASDIAQDATDQVVFGFDLTPSAEVTFDALTLTHTGTASDTDVTNIRLVQDVNTNGTYDSGTDVVVDTTASSFSGGGSESISFSSFSTTQTISSATNYLIIADIDGSATTTNTIIFSIAATSDVSTDGDESGTVSGTTQTIISASSPVITVTGSLSAFGNVAAGSNSSSQNYTIEGSNLSENIKVKAPTGFKVSTDNSTFSDSLYITQTGGTVNSTLVYVVFAPSTDDGSKTGNITHESAGATTQNIAVEGFAFASEPSTAASNLSFTSVGETSFTVNWTRGDGDSVLVVIKSGSAVTFDPSDATAYDANASFGASTELGTGNFAVYLGTGTSVEVSGLSYSTTYHVEVFEFNVGNADLTHNYLTTSSLIGSQLTDGPDNIEGFDNFVGSGSSYISGSFSGINGATWTFTDARGDQSINGATPMLRNNTSASLTATFSGGVSTISFDYKKAFSTSVNLDVFINDVLVTTITSASTTVENSGNIDVYAVGDFTIEFKQNTSPQGGQVLIDNVAWNSYSDGTQEITGTAGWRMLSAPITGFTVSDISDNTAIQGISGGDNTSATANFYYYGSTGSFASPADVSTAFGDGYGFITYFYNNTNAGSSELPITLDVSGTEPSNDVDVTLNKTLTPFENDPSNEDATHYYTLVGNPYASNFDLSTLAVDADALDANVLVWDNASSDYQPMATADGIVAPWQGFWVSVPSNEAATTLTFPTSGKTSLSSTASYFKAVANAQSNIEGLISMSHNGITSAPVKLQMKEDAVLGDDRNDLVKFTPLSSSYATVGALIPASTVLHAIHALPIELSEPVQVIIEPMIKGNSGEFTLNWSAFSSFPDIYVVELFDSETGNTYNLRENGSLTFTQVSKAAATDNDLKTLTATSNGNSRFKVNITPITTSVENGIAVPTTVALSQNFPNPFNPSTKIAYAVPAQASVRLAVYDMLGREVALLVNTVKAAGKYEVTFDASALASGMYIYRLQANGTVLTQKMTLIK